MNLLHMTGILRTIDPHSVRDIVIDDDLTLNTTINRAVANYRFNPGYLLYIILKVDDGGTGLGRYVYFKAQRLRREQVLAKPDVAGMPIEMVNWSAWRARGANPGLLEYDDDKGIYVIEGNFHEGSVQIEEPYKVSIHYPRREVLVAYGDETAISNYGADISVEVKIAVKEINYQRAYSILKDLYTDAMADGIIEAIFRLLSSEQMAEKVKAIGGERESEGVKELARKVVDLVKPIPYKPE